MRPKTRPIAIEIGTPQIEDSLCPLHSPAHARSFHAVLDQMATGSFGDAAADGIASDEVLVVVHPGAVVMEIGDDGLHGFELSSLQLVFGSHLFESSDDIADLAFEQHLQSLPYPRFSGGAALGMEDVCSFPQIFHDMPQIQNGDGFWQVALLQGTQRSLSVTEKDHRFRGGSLSLMGLLSQRLKQAVLVIQQFGLDSFMIGARSLGW